MATEKQAAANRSNAKKSKGPKSPAGKKSASRNAFKHGAYAHELYPIDRGPLAEWEGEFYERVEELLAGFDPHDALEAELAKRGVKGLMTLARLDRLESKLINQEAMLEPQVKASLGDLTKAESYLRRAETLIEMVILDKDEGLPTHSDLVSCSSKYLPEDWEYIAPLVRKMCPEKITVRDVWTDDKEPSTPAEWASAVRAIWAEFLPDYEDRLGWARWVMDCMESRYEDVKLKTEAVVANRVINGAMERVERPRTHAWKEVNQAMAQLAAVRRMRHTEE